jgi:hypothetical protein
MQNKNIWMCGVPGSRWSGVDIILRECLPCDRTDETPDRTFYHRVNIPGDPNNGHRGSYWGPGMGCGEDWKDFNKLTLEKLQSDIDEVFTGEGYRVIKSHFFARGHNLEWIWNNCPGDYMFLIYREPVKSFAWWAEVMDFVDDHYPDYRPGYKNYDTMRERIFEESAKIVDFVITKGYSFKHFTAQKAFSDMPGYNPEFDDVIRKGQHDIYFAMIQIPE